MASNRCFHTIDQTIINASDLTQSKRQRTIYNNLTENTLSVYGPNPIKNNGSRYNNNFVVKGGGIGSSDACLVSAKSYDLLLDLTKGKRFANPVLDGASATTNELWIGNVLELDYSGNNIIPVRSIDISTNNTIQDGDDNAIIFPSPCLDDCSWNSTAYPGFTIDPSQQMFYYSCDVPYIKSVCDVSFRNTNYYWKAVNAQPLNGMNYPAPLKIGRQETDNTTDIYIQYAPEQEDNTEWCDGKHAIK